MNATSTREPDMTAGSPDAAAIAAASLPFERDGVLHVPVHHMRGGTSTGIVLYRPSLPKAPRLIEEIVRHIMGVPQSGTRPGNRQTTGLGRGLTTSNKVFLIDHADGVDADFTSTLLQLAADTAEIDWSVNCGNMSAAIPMYLLDRGLLAATPGTTTVRVRNTNTDVVADFRVRTPDGTSRIPADTEIPGVAGAFPGVELSLRHPIGAKTGALLPTGAVRDTIDGVDVSCIDVAVPMIIIRAADLGVTGFENVAELEADTALKERLRGIWTQAGLLMGLRTKDGTPMTAEQLARSETIPKVCLVAPPAAGGNITARYFTPQTVHTSLAVTGGCCLATACLIPGTTAHDVATGLDALTATMSEPLVGMEHPAGLLRARVRAATVEDGLDMPWAAYERSAQILLAGAFPIHDPSAELLSHFT